MSAKKPEEHQYMQVIQAKAFLATRRNAELIFVAITGNRPPTGI